VIIIESSVCLKTADSGLSQAVDASGQLAPESRTSVKTVPASWVADFVFPARSLTLLTKLRYVFHNSPTRPTSAASLGNARSKPVFPASSSTRSATASSPRRPTSCSRSTGSRRTRGLLESASAGELGFALRTDPCIADGEFILWDHRGLFFSLLSRLGILDV
jgi:hypothetical protein